MRELVRTGSNWFMLPVLECWKRDAGSEISGIPRMSSVTIFQSDEFVLSTIYSSNLTFRSSQLPGSFFRKR